MGFVAKQNSDFCFFWDTLMFNMSREYRRSRCELISLNHKIDCCICSSGSRAFPAGFVQQNLPRFNFVGSSNFSISLISSIQRRIISPFLGNYVTFPIFNYGCIKENSKWLCPPSQVLTFSKKSNQSKVRDLFFAFLHCINSAYQFCKILTARK